MRSFALLILAASLALSAGLAYWRVTHGRPALRDLAALQGRGPLPSIRPPFYRPLAGLPFESAAVIWLGLNAAAGMAFGYWAVRRTGEPALALLLAVFVPAIVAISVGQDSLLLLAVLAGVFVTLESRRPLAAGLLLSLLWVKFQLLPAFVLLLVVRREWRALLGLALGTAAILMADAPELPGYVAYLRRMSADPGVVPCRTCMPNLRAFIPWPKPALAASAALLAASVMRFRAALPFAFALALSGALLASYHAHIYDCVLLFMAAVLVMGRSPALGLAVSPLPYLLAYAWGPAQLLPALTATAAWVSVFRMRPPGPSE